ncbi:putative exonuclease [Erwinia phage vB_EamM_Yoloswag]|uniref:Putative exonuclease n=1 Tax=Erwinia phage vB_EamM_Yoloswag TaxID=1958956 RepID=A0A1S6L3D5_9CAUD|nr:CRISPR/Cas system associated [Erwinia phage vB_EamM_Yoloswag]AQT28701.1 putative exonuclease [Erwinia phage vB_EamM_Yoloswag]
MRTFDAVPKFIDHRKLSRIGKMIDAALDHTVKERREYVKKRVSPSMFPICSVQEYAKQLYSKHNRAMTGESGTMLNIFAKAGTGMHESVQNALGFSGQMVGHWKCQNRKCAEHHKTKDVWKDGRRVKKGKYTRTNSTDNMCPNCKQPMAYSELKVLYKSLKGFVDGLIDNLDGTYSIIDLKSTMVSKAQDGSFFVKYHRYQIATYAYILSKRYGYNIVDYTLVYVPRDNPKKFVEKSFVYDEKEARAARDFMMKQINAWDATIKSLRKGDAKYAIKHKPCRSEKYYWDEFHGYDECPFLNYCFIESRLTEFLERLEQTIMANPDMTYAEVVRPQAEPQQGLVKKKFREKTKVVKQFEL